MSSRQILVTFHNLKGSSSERHNILLVSDLFPEISETSKLISIKRVNNSFEIFASLDVKK